MFVKLAERELLVFARCVPLERTVMYYSYVYTRFLGGEEKYLTLNQMAHGECEFILSHVTLGHHCI